MHKLIDMKLGTKLASMADIVGNKPKITFCNNRINVNKNNIIMQQLFTIIKYLLNFVLNLNQVPVSMKYPTINPWTNGQI